MGSPSATTAKPKVAAPTSTSRFPLHTSRTSSGLSAIYNFGDQSVDSKLGSGWLYQRQLTADAPNYQLRPGMQGRHIFGPLSSLSGRCFEWTVHRDVGNAGLPLYCVSEFELDGSGFRKSSKVSKASSPYEVWNKLFTEVLELPPPNKGAQYCGFRDPSLVALLKLDGAAVVQQYELKPNGGNVISQQPLLPHSGEQWNPCALLIHTWLSKS